MSKHRNVKMALKQESMFKKFFNLVCGLGKNIHFILFTIKMYVV